MRATFAPKMFMQEHYGKLDTALAEAYLSDHYDIYEHKIDAGKRSLCGHEDTSPVGEKVWDDPPFEPGGAVTGKVTELGAGGEDELHRPGRPSLRRRFSCGTVSESASGVRMAEADTARHDRRTVDAVQFR